MVRYSNYYANPRVHSRKNLGQELTCSLNGGLEYSGRFQFISLWPCKKNEYPSVRRMEDFQAGFYGLQIIGWRFSRCCCCIFVAGRQHFPVVRHTSLKM